MAENRRTLEFQIGTEEDGMTVQEFLKKNLSFSSRQISRLKFRQDGIRVNGEQYYVTWQLRAGDHLEIGLQDDRKPARTGWLTQEEAAKIAGQSGKTFRLPPVEVLYEDDDVLAVNKAAVLVCHPSPGHYADTLSNQAAEYLAGQEATKDRHCRIHLTGRLDRDTSGVVLFAKNQDAAAALQRQRERGEYDKLYLALAEGSFPCTEKVLCDPIGKVPGVLMKMETVREGGKEALTFVRILEQTGDCALLLCRIRHGRTHQIRVHLSSDGHPLLYDSLSGKEEEGKHFFLHAAQVQFIKPFVQQKILVTAPLPDEFRRELSLRGFSCAGDIQERLDALAAPHSGCNGFCTKDFQTDHNMVR